MPTIAIFNNQTGRTERYLLPASAPMPYSSGAITVGEFSARRSPVWTDLATMQAYSALAEGFAGSIEVLRGLLTPGSDSTGGLTQHFAGTALLLRPRKAECLAGRTELAESLGMFSAVQESEDSLYVDCRYLPVAGRLTAGYPTLFRGSANNYVYFLQQALISLGLYSGPLDGIFGALTDRALREFQRRALLTQDGICSGSAWVALTALSEAGLP